MSNPNFELLWYLNITMSQAIELVEKGNEALAIQYLKNAKQQIAEVYPEAMQADELPAKESEK